MARQGLFDELGEASDSSPAMRIAGELLDETLHSQAAELRAAYLDRRSDYPAKWRHVLGHQNDILYLAPDELATLKQELAGLLGNYRRLSGNERPPGARRIHALIDFSPWFEPDTGPPQTS